MSNELIIKATIQGKDQAIEALDQIKNKAKEIANTDVSPKVQELDKGTIKGLFKDIQEGMAAMANGGVSRGFEQLGTSVKRFSESLANGGSLTDAMSEGVHAIGVEGAVVGASMLAAGAAVGVLAQQMVSAYTETARLEQTARLAGTSVLSLEDATNGLVSAQQALALHQSALNNGFQLQGTQLDMVSREAARFSQVTGTDLNQSLGLVQQALSGNAGAARQLGVSVSDTSTRAQVLDATLQSLQQRSNSLGGVRLDPGLELERAGRDIKELFTSVLAIGGQIVIAVIEPLLGGLHEMATGVRSVAQGIREWFGAAESTTENLRQQQIVEQQIAAAHERTAQAERDRALVQAQQLQDSISSANQQAEYWGVGVRNAMDVLTLTQRTTQAFTELNAIHQRENESDSDFEQRRAAAQTRYINAARDDTTRQQARFDREITLGLQQRELEIHGRSVSLGVTGLTNQQAQARVRQEINRIQQLSLYFENGMSEAMRDQLDHLNQRLVALQTSATQSGQQREQQLRAVQDLERERSLRLEMTAIQRDGVGATNDMVDIVTRATALHDRIDHFTFNTHGNLQRQTETYQRLIAQAQQLDSAVQTINQNNEQIGARQAANDNSHRSAVTAFNAANYQGASQQLALGLRALQIQRDGGELTESQRQSIQDMTSNVDILNESHARTADRLREINDLLRNAPTPERGKELLEERNNLLNRQAQTEQQIRDVQQQQHDPTFADRMANSLKNLTGGYRSFSDVLVGQATGAIQAFAGAFAKHISAVVQGKESFSEAMRAMTNEVTTQLAEQALGKMIMEIAEGIACLARGAASYGGDVGAETGAPMHFASAAMFGAIAGVGYGVAAATAAPAGSSGGSGSGSPNALPSGQSSTASSPPSNGPVVINLNMQPYSTAEDVSDAIYDGYHRARSRRTGT